MKFRLGEIAEKLDLEVIGDASVEIAGLAKLTEAGPDQLAFLFSSAYRRHLEDTRAAAVVLHPDDADAARVPVLLSAQPRLAWARIAALFDRTPGPTGEVHPTAVVDPQAVLAAGVSVGANAVIEAGADIGERAVIGAGCFVGAGTRIGHDSRLFANVNIYHEVEIGAHCIIHAGAVIGADGFGFEFDRSTGSLVKIPQIFSVIIGDRVEIGAGTTIDRGALNHTRLGDGVKLDNQVQVGHGTTIGANTAISGCTAIAGSTRIGSYCLIGGAVGIIDNLVIADQVEITAMSLVSQSITEKGRYSSGTGLMPSRDWKRNIVGFRKLDDLLRRVRKLEKTDRQD